MKIEEERAHSEQRRKQIESPRKENENLNKTYSEAEKIKMMEQKIKKLTQKLEFANKKILELLKEKAKRSDNTDVLRTRSNSYSPEHDYHKMLLEYRDCSFVPMCPPAIIEPVRPFGPF